MYKWANIFSKRMLSFIPLYRRYTEAQRDCHILKTTLGGRVEFQIIHSSFRNHVGSFSPRDLLAVACGSGLVCWCHCPSSVASVTNYHKLSGLIQPVISPAVWRPELQTGSWPVLFRGSRGAAASLPFLSPRGHLHFTPLLVPFSIFKASKHLLPPVLLYSALSEHRLLSTSPSNSPASFSQDPCNE